MRAGGLLLIFRPIDRFCNRPGERNNADEHEGIIEYTSILHKRHPLLMERGKEAIFSPLSKIRKESSGANRQNALDLSTTYVTPSGVTLMILCFDMICKAKEI